MPVNKIEAVIFDLGNVLLDFDHKIAAKRLAEFTKCSSKQMYELFFDSELTGLFEEGKISANEFFLEVKRALDLKIGYQEFVPIWNEIFSFSQKNHQVYDLASSLKSRYRIALLSNINLLHFEYVSKTFPILDAFHNIVTSFEEKLRKPDHLIYRNTLRILGSSAEGTFYTDDRQELIDSAKQLGIKGFTFTGIKKLKNDLLESGVIL